MRYSQSLLKSYQYVMEIVLLYVLLILFYIHTDHLPPLVPYLFITCVGAIIIGLLLSLIKSNTPYFFIMLAVPLLALISSEMGSSFGQSLIIAAVVCYRIIIHYYKNPKLTEAMILNGSLIVGGLIYFAARVQGYIHSDLVLYLLVTQLLFFMIGKIINNVSKSSVVMKNIVTKNNSWSVVGLCSGLFVGSIVFSIVLPIIFVKGMSFVASIIGTGLYYVSKPLFNAVEDMDSVRGSHGESVGSLNMEKTEKKNSFFEILGSFDIWFFLSILGLLILAGILFFLAKKRFVKEAVTVGDMYQYTTVTEEMTKPSTTLRLPKRQNPQAKVRKLILELEMLSAKQGLGRYHHESVREWLRRNDILDNHLVDLYERVRYGNEVLTKEENESCEEVVKQVKAKIKIAKQSK